MTILSRYNPLVKPGAPPPRHPDACPACLGYGRVDDISPCPGCDGFGRVRFVLFSPAGPPDEYVALTADGVLETSRTLSHLVAQMQQTWPAAEDDVAVFRTREGEGCRLVALLRPDAGGLSVRYL